MTYGDTGDTVMLPLWQMGMWRGDVWGHREVIYGDTGGGDPDGHVGAQRGCMGTRGGMFGDAEGDSLTSPLWHMGAHMGTQEGDVEGTP